MRQVTAAACLLVVCATTVVRGQDAPDANRAFDAFLRAYWDPARKVVYRDSEHRGGTPSDYWWSAHIFETFLDAYRATGQHRELIDQFYDGFVAQHPDWLNDWDDDLGWWALALLRAYEVTGEARFKERAVALWESIGAFEDSTYGGGLWWKRNGDAPQKGVPISAPWIMAAVKIAALTGDAKYVAAAKREYDWLEKRFVGADGRVNDHIEGAGDGTVIEWQLTYNYGTWIGACLALYDATGDRAYYDKAVKSARASLRYVAKDGVFQNEGDDDGAGFKMILTRSLAELAARGEEWLAPVLEKNARSAWKNRRADGLMGTDWAAPAPSGPIQSFAAASAVDLLFHARPAPAPRLGEALRRAVESIRLAILRATPTPATTGANPGTLVVEAEDGELGGVGTEATRAGFSGSGYVAGWNEKGQSVTLRVNAPAAGDYVLAFRYSAEAGDAARMVSVNGHPVAKLALQGTESWGDYRTVSLPKVRLEAGENTIVVGYSKNYVNLDRLSVARAPGAASLTRGMVRVLGRS